MCKYYRLSGLLFTIVLSYSLCYSQAYLKEIDLVNFFETTMKKAFNEKTDTTLYKKFLNCYIESNGKYILTTEKDKVNNINSILFTDQVYTNYFKNVLIINKDSVSLQLSEDLNTTIVEYLSTKEYSRYNGEPHPQSVYFSDAYLLKIFKYYKKGFYIIDKFYDEVQNTGQINMKYFARYLLVSGIKQIENPIVKEITSLAFWKYICYCSNIDFHKKKPLCSNCLKE